MSLTTGDIGDCCCCSVKFLTACAGAVEPSVSVWIGHGTPPQTIATGTSDANGELTLDIGAPGIYSVTASGLNVGTFSATMALACGRAYTLDICEVICTWQLVINTYNIQGGTPMPTSGSITIAGNSNGLTTTATVPVGIAVLMSLGPADPDPAHYTITVSYGGQTVTYISYCGEIVGFDAYPYVVSGCLGASGAIFAYGLPGCTVTLIATGQTQTTDANGQYFFLMAPGTPSTITIQAPSGKFLPYSGPMGNVSLSPAPNYVCTTCCNIPVCDELTMTDDAGTAILIYGQGVTNLAALGPFAPFGPYSGWVGLMNANAPAACNCPGGPVPVLAALSIGGSPGACTASLVLVVPTNVQLTAAAFDCYLCFATWGNPNLGGPPWCPGIRADGTLGSINPISPFLVSTSCDPFEANYSTPMTSGCYECGVISLDPGTGGSIETLVPCAMGNYSPLLIWGQGPLIDTTTITENC